MSDSINAAQVAKDNAELERLREFAKCVLREYGRLETSGGRPVITHQWPEFFARINDAIARLDAAARLDELDTANPAPVTEPMGGAE